MKTKLTNKQFKQSSCAGCIWIRKVDDGHYFCPFGSKCMKEEEKRVREEIETGKRGAWIGTEG